jgi:hypothetical protein
VRISEGIAAMKMISLRLSIAVAIGIFGAVDGLSAKPLTKKQKAELACDRKFTACDDKCGKLQNATKSRNCSAVCSHEHRHCLSNAK